MVTEAESRVKKVEAKIVELGEVALKEASAALAYVREKIAKAKEPEAKKDEKKEEKKEEKKTEGEIAPRT